MTDLAAALIAGVPRYTCLSAYGPPDQFMEEADVLAALTAALDGVEERAGEVVERLQGGINNMPLTTLGGVMHGEPCLAAADLITALLAQNAALRAERDDAVNKAKKNARIAAKAYTIITLASDDLQDEGDRVYLGSTNTADILRDAREEWAAHRIIGDSVLTIVEENRVLKTRTEAAEAVAEKLRGALRELIDHTHNCEKELTEELHGADFCGESLPLTNARAALTTEERK